MTAQMQATWFLCVALIATGCGEDTSVDGGGAGAGGTSGGAATGGGSGGSDGQGSSTGGTDSAGGSGGQDSSTGGTDSAGGSGGSGETDDGTDDFSELSLEDTPDAVQSAVAAELPQDAEVEEVWSFDDEGTTIYEVIYYTAEGGGALYLADDGTLLARADFVEPGDLPAAVLATIEDELGADAEYEAQIVTEDGETFYEVYAEVDGEEVYLLILEDGTLEPDW